MYDVNSDFSSLKAVTEKDLAAVYDMPVLNTELFDKPVIIDSFEFMHNHNLYFLRVRSTDGSVGESMCSNRAKYLFPILEQLILPYFIGKDARFLDSLIDGVYITNSNYKLAGLPLWCPISWAEAAILDLLGKISGKCVSDLLGERLRDEIDIYVASGNRGTTPAEETEILDKRISETGAKAIKFKVGGRMSRNADSIQGRSEELLLSTRRHFGDSMIIHADGNGSYDVEHGIRIGKLCEDINAYFYEEPCPFDDLWATKAVADGLNIPLAFGEQETSARRFMWLIENHACRVLQPDLQYNGGFIRTTKVSRMAEAAGMTVTPHVSNGSASVYTLLFLSYTPNIGKYHEYKDFNDCYDMFTPHLKAENGKVSIPSGSGLCITADDKRIFKNAYRIFTVK